MKIYIFILHSSNILHIYIYISQLVFIGLLFFFFFFWKQGDKFTLSFGKGPIGLGLDKVFGGDDDDGDPLGVEVRDFYKFIVPLFSINYY